MPKSWASRVVLIEDEPATPNTSVPTTTTTDKTTEIATTVSTVTSTVTALNPTQVSQSSRALAISKILSCSDNSDQIEAPAFTDSPTQLAIGDSSQRYNLGTIVGNWVLLGSTTLVATAVSAKLGTEKAHFPGVLSVPVAFFMEPTMTAGVSLVRDTNSTWTQKLIGGCSITAQTIGVGLVAVFLHPSHFKATWSAVAGKWIDMAQGGEHGYVHRYGMIFEAYGEHNQGFIGVELLTSAATGIIQSFPTMSDCAYSVTALGCVLTTYALSLLIRQPHHSKFDRIFYTSIAAVQAVAVDTLAIAMWAAYDETKQKVQSAVQTILSVTQWALFAKTVGEQAKRIYSCWSHWYYEAKAPTPSVQATTATVALTDVVDNTGSAVELGSFSAATPSSQASSRPSTPMLPPVLAQEDSVFSSRSTTPTSVDTTPPGPPSSRSTVSLSGSERSKSPVSAVVMGDVEAYIRGLYGEKPDEVL